MLRVWNFLQSACWPGLLGFLCLAFLASGLWPAPAAAATISNTASASYLLPSGSVTLSSNTVSLLSLPAPTPAVLRFYQYAPAAADSQPLRFDGGAYHNGTAFQALPAPGAIAGVTLDFSAPIRVRPTTLYHAGEPVFLVLTDANRNTDPSLRETIELTLRSSRGTVLRLRLLETEEDSGLFAAVVATAAAPVASVSGLNASVASGALLSLEAGDELQSDYQDAYYPTDTARADALVDPFGLVFDAMTGALLSGVTVTLIDTSSGLPALVFGDDGVSRFPATVVTGQRLSDSSGRQYQLPEGGFRFPFVQPGSYRLVVNAPAGYIAPSSVPVGSLPTAPDGSAFAVGQGSYADIFTVVAGPALRVDIPLDPHSQNLVLQKSVSKPEASAGDFLQYQLNLQNIDASQRARALLLTDRLPLGLRYQAGSLRRDGQALPEPQISADGRTLSINPGELAAGASTRISYVTLLGAGVSPGDAVNTAQARANGGSLSSNVAQVSVRVREPLFSSRATLIGRVLEGDCGTPWAELKGVANARVMLEDGSYVITDKDGQYHFEAVRPGTHVVQLDSATLPGGLEPVACQANTRFAGRADSQFVDVKGGSLWRADFYTRARRADIGIRSQTTLSLSTPVAPAPVAKPATKLMVQRAVKNYTLRAEFDSCSASLQPSGEAAVAGLIKELQSEDIARIELMGHSDNQRLSLRCQQQFKNNQQLSEARARTLGEQLAAGLKLWPEQIVVSGLGDAQPEADNRTPEGRARNRRTELRVHMNEPVATVAALSETAVAPLPEATVLAESKVSGLRQRIEVDGGAAVGQLRVMAKLPAGLEFVPGSARVDGLRVADPELQDQLAVFRLGEQAAGWQRVIEFELLPPVAPAPVAEMPAARRYNLRLPFGACSASLPAQDPALQRLVSELRGQRLVNLQLLGHGDNQRLSPRCQAQYGDNQGLSQARAQALADYLAQQLGLPAERVQVQGLGDSQPLKSNATAAGRAANRRIEVVAQAAAQAQAPSVLPAEAACRAEGWALKAIASVDLPGQKPAQTPAVDTQVNCQQAAVASPRESVSVRLSGNPAQAALPARAAPVEDAVASGGKTDWLAGQQPGQEWLFPTPDHNPRAPAVRVVIKHAPEHSVQLLGRDGKPVSPLSFDGVQYNADRSVAVSVWRGLPLIEGDNVFVADIQGADGASVARLQRSVYYANIPARAELVPELSRLYADGINRPVLALRLLDRAGRPVRAGITGPVSISAPYRAWEQVDQEQRRQLAGMDRFQPSYHVEGDQGLAFVELAPTTESGAVQLGLNFQIGQDGQRHQDLRAWLAPRPRDWVVVGFAEGTLGYQTLKDNVEALQAQGEDEGVYSDGQISLYAKGRVRGEWLLTLAYDSDKPREQQPGLFSGIDPKAFYTLYGDGSQQRFDAPSQDKLYLKLERGQFYALFGDYETGLVQSQLARYSRTLNGLKLEKGDGPFSFIAFAAETPQNFARDEIRGDGTSGLYRFSQRDLVLNSERLSLETRDRLQPQRVLEARALTRHIDYDIDYAAGTVFFRQPVLSHDGSFNPVFIVAEYETQGPAEQQLNAGGRLGLSLQEGKLELGLSAIHDENRQAATELTGVDLKLKLAADTELRLEAAGSQSEAGVVAGSKPGDGTAWLAELEHHKGRFDGLLYGRYQEPGFGVKQQSGADTGQQKIGVDGQYRLSSAWALQGQVYQQENLQNQATRDALMGNLRYKGEQGGFSLGAQLIGDTAGSGASAGQDFSSQQATFSANRFFMKKRLELLGQADLGLGGESASLDFPDRFLFGAAFALTDEVKLLAGQEFTDGAALDSSTSRVGLQVQPWKGARLESTLNQSQISEYGPRTFGQLGLTQAVLLNERWGLDFSIDSNHTLHDSGATPPVLNPVTAGGAGVVNGGVATEDFTAFSAGASYRAPLWSWNGRLESRDGERSDRHGISTSFLRQAQAGVAFASSLRLFQTEESEGASGLLGSVDLSWAWRPLGSQWSLLDRLELRYDALDSAGSQTAPSLFGQNGLSVAGSAKSRRLINNLALNRVSGAWQEADTQGNLFQRYQRSQWSLYYGAKYAMDSFDEQSFSGYTDLVGFEVRHDVKPWLDVGLQASSLNAWSAGSHAYSFGPMLGFSPVENGWVTVGFNLRGFMDSDFDAARYTAEGFYLQLRLKFDQKTRLRLPGRAAEVQP